MIKISVKDFGPVIDGAVTLQPLTVFVGPSNAGKSYLATLIYSLMQSFEGFPSVHPGVPINLNTLFPRSLYRHIIPPDILANIGADGHVTKAITKWLQNIEVDNDTTLKCIPADLPLEMQDLIDRTVDYSLERIGYQFDRHLQRYHGALADIQRRTASDAQLQITVEQIQPFLRLIFEEAQQSLRTSSESGRQWDISQSRFEIEGDLVGLMRQMQISGHVDRPREYMELAYRDLLAFLAHSASATLVASFPANCYYLPAARSGIAQGHKAIASILVRQSSFAALRPLDIPTLSGIITDFMGHILTLEQEPTWHTGMSDELTDVVDFLERKVVHGTIDIERSRELTYPEISYAPIADHQEGVKFPFHRTSSMVSELAPVILFLKYLVRPGDLVILEEPESHLHPASQRQMARGIARLVNAGVKVIITTHSDYFIGQINNLLKLHHASRYKRNKEGYSTADCLDSDNVSAHYFRMDNALGGSKIEELPIVRDFGIDEREFADVSEALYDETIALQGIQAKGS